MSPSQRGRRRKPSATARLRPFWIVIVLAGVLLVVLGYVAVTWDGFKPKGIEVLGARPPVSVAEITAAAAIDPEQNIWLMHRATIAQRVEHIPFVKSAEVHRGWPNHLDVTVVLRTPAFRVQTQGAVLTLDDELRVLRRSIAVDGLLPLLRDPSLPTPTVGTFVTAVSVRALRDDYVALVGANVRPVLLEHDRYGGLDITLHDGVIVELGDEDDLGKKIPLIDPLLAHVANRIATVRAIDLRAPSAPVVEYKK